MDLTGSLQDVFGVSGPLFLAIAGLVAVLLAGSVSATVLEVARIYGEYTAPAPSAKGKAAETPRPPGDEKADAGKVYITQLGDMAAQQRATAPATPPAPAIAPVDVVLATLPDSMKAITGKYGLAWLTIASADGLVIASTSATPDEDAAVYSNLFHELYRTRPEPYFNVANKDIHLLLVESGGQKVIDVAGRAGTMTRDDAAGLRDDSRKIVERFVWGAKPQK